MKQLYSALLLLFAVHSYSQEVTGNVPAEKHGETKSTFYDIKDLRKIEVNTAFIKVTSTELEEIKKDSSINIYKYSESIYRIEKNGNFDKAQVEFIKKHLPTKIEEDSARRNVWKSMK